MKKHSVWSNILVIFGLICMLVGAIDPLEGSLLILPACGLLVLGAVLGRSAHFRFILLAFVLTVIGIGALFALSWFGGVGGSTGHSKWWLLAVLPYPAGWLMGIAGAIRRLIEVFRAPAQ